MSPNTPERRSDADLQRILDGLIGDTGTILSGELPNVLAEYERKHNLIIIEPSEYDQLQALCSQHSDLEMHATELFQFLSMIPKAPRPQSPPSPSPYQTSATQPPSSFPQEVTLDTLRRRRHSDRIKSPSDSSSSGSEDNIDPRGQRQSSAPVESSSRPFPGSGHSAPIISSSAGKQLPPKRVKTLSDSSRYDSPLSARARTTGPPSAYGNLGTFARPSPAGRRRRTSRDNFDDDGTPSPDGPGVRSFGYGRCLSSGSLALSSPTWPVQMHGSRPSSPFSPTDALDQTSFHERAKSPEEIDEFGELEQAERNIIVIEDNEDLDHDVDDVDMDVAGEMLGPTDDKFNSRLGRIATESSASLRTSHDKLRALQKQNSDLARKFKESERQLTVLGSENERLVEDLQERLEEAKTEVALRKKEEKELKGKDRAQSIQISSLEADIENLRRSLENSRANHASMQKMYNSQCEEAQRLRDLLRDRDAEIDDLEQGAQSHEADEEKFNREIKALESEVKRLESDLAITRQAESVLEVQKLENLQLKETIDRMKFDLEEARAVSIRGISASHQRGVTGSSGGGTLSRNLGDELSRRFTDAENNTNEVETGGESVIETIVTRTRKIGGRTVGPGVSVASESALGDLEIREYADAGVETEPLPAVVSPVTAEMPNAGPSRLVDFVHSTSPPAYTAVPQPITEQKVLDRVHPRNLSGHLDGDAEDDYDCMVDALGLRCEVIEEEMRIRKAEREKRAANGGTIPSSHKENRKRRDSSKPDVINYIFYQNNDSFKRVSNWVAWTAIVFGIGLIIGGGMMGAPAGMDPRDYQLFHQMNTIATAAGVGEGFLPRGSMSMLGVVEQGARFVAGRVPS